MIYITEEDLKTDAYERFIDESTADFAGVKDKAEAVAVGIAKTLLKGRYNVALIFDADEPIRDEYLVEIITKLTLCKIFGRNAARKLPTDLKDDHTWAMKELKDINGGKVLLDLPIKIDTEGNPISDSIWGNNRNDNFYI